MVVLGAIHIQLILWGGDTGDELPRFVIFRSKKSEHRNDKKLKIIYDILEIWGTRGGGWGTEGSTGSTCLLEGSRSV